MVLDELKDKLLRVTFTYDQLVYILDALEPLAEDDETLNEIMNVFDEAEVLEEVWDN